MVYHIVDELHVGVMVTHDDIIVGKHWPRKVEVPPEQWLGYYVWRDHGHVYTSDAMEPARLNERAPQQDTYAGQTLDAASRETRAGPLLQS